MRSTGIVVLFALLASVILAVCGQTTPTAPAAATAALEATAPTGVTASQVEVFSWWTGGGEAAGLDAMIKVFNEQHPDISFVNAAVAGGAGTNARAVLATRLQANDPPDSFALLCRVSVGRECSRLSFDPCLPAAPVLRYRCTYPPLLQVFELGQNG